MSNLGWWLAMLAVSGAAGALGYWQLAKTRRLRDWPLVLYVVSCLTLPLLLRAFHPHRPLDFTLAVFTVGLVVLSFEDILRGVVPNRVLLVLLAVAVVQLALGFAQSWWIYAATALLLGGVMMGISLLSKGGFGMGDAKLIGVIALFLGPISTMTALLVGSICGALFAVVLWVRTKDRKTTFPYAPFLALGCFAAMYIM